MSIKGLSKDEQVAFEIVAKRMAQAEIEANPALQSEKEIKQAKQKQIELLREHIKKFDDARLGELPLVAQRKREELVEILDWKKGDGLCPLHFADKQPGSQCTWTVEWVTGSGVLRPRDYYPIEQMSGIELIVEARDLCNQKVPYAVRKPDKNMVMREIAPIVAAFEAGEVPALHSLRKKIRIVRQNYTSYMCPWNRGPSSLFGPIMTRPGWGDTEKLKQRFLELHPIMEKT